MSKKRKSPVKLESVEVPVQDPADAPLETIDPATSPVGTEFEEIDIGDTVTYPDQDMQGGLRQSIVTEVFDTDIEVIWRDGSRRIFPRHKINKV